MNLLSLSHLVKKDKKEQKAHTERKKKKRRGGKGREIIRVEVRQIPVLLWLWLLPVPETVLVFPFMIPVGKKLTLEKLKRSEGKGKWTKGKWTKGVGKWGGEREILITVLEKSKMRVAVKVIIMATFSMMTTSLGVPFSTRPSTRAMAVMPKQLYTYWCHEILINAKQIVEATEIVPFLFQYKE